MEWVSIKEVEGSLFPILENARLRKTMICIQFFFFFLVCSVVVVLFKLIYSTLGKLVKK